MSEELSLDLRAKFSRELEKISRATGTVIESLRTIRDEKLWVYGEDSYDSFADFCQRRLRISEGRASQIITATDVASRMTVLLGGDSVLAKQIEALPERTIRELKDVTPQKAIEIVQKIASQGNGKVTTRAVREEVRPVQDVPVVIVPKNKQAADFTADDWLMVLKQDELFVKNWLAWGINEKGNFKNLIETAIKEGFREEWRKSALQTPKEPPIDTPPKSVAADRPKTGNMWEGVDLATPIELMMQITGKTKNDVIIALREFKANQTKP